MATAIGELILALSFSLAAGGSAPTGLQPGERYVSASVNAVGDLQISTEHGQVRRIRKIGDQVGFGQIEISPGADAVGWVGMQVNCCTSYDIPTRLYLLTGGRIQEYEGNGLPVWNWSFTSNGRELAFHQETVHGAVGVHYELRDVASGRLVAEWRPVIGSDNQPLAAQVVPQWVRDLDAKKH